MTSSLQSEASFLLDRLTQRKHSLAAEIATIDREIEAVATTLRLLGVDAALSTSAPPAAPAPAAVANEAEQAFAKYLRGKTTRASLRIIAKANGGRVKIAMAKPLLLQAGVIKNPKRAWGMIYTVLGRAPEFKKADDERGAFDLIGQSAA